MPKKVKRNSKTVLLKKPWSPTPGKATAKGHLVDEEEGQRAPRPRTRRRSHQERQATLLTTSKAKLREIVTESPCHNRLPGLQIHQRSGRSSKPACIATGGSALTCCGRRVLPLSYSQPQLAQLVGVSIGTVKAWESRRRAPNRDPAAGG